jgi:DNA-binding response OmpR family regulator
MTVLLLSGDLAVLARVEGAARRAGEAVRQVANGAQATGICQSENVRLVVVDLSTPGLEIAAVIRQLRSEPSSGSRVIAFGPHVHEQRLAEAREAGCDLVVTRGQFFSQLDSLLAADAGA